MEKYIKFSCDTCDHKIKTLIKNAGKMGNCPKCKVLCVIPQPEYTIFDIEKDLAELGCGDALQRSGTGTNIPQ